MMDELKQFPEALTIAGTDSGGGAGMEADIKTMQACHTFSTNVVVGVTAQNTYGVQDLYPLPQQIIDAQFASIMADFEIRAAKTGALFDLERVQMVVKNLKKYQIPNLVVDPVMVAKGGAKLLTDEAIQTLKTDLLPLATLVTPNLPEAELLADQKVETQVDMLNAAKRIQTLGCPNVIIKGGHGHEAVVYDFVKLGDDDEFWLESKRIDTIRTHGTGDTLSSAIVAYLAQGIKLETAIHQAHDYLATIISQPLPIGHGHGPLNHGEWSNHEI
ncbi:bifunctional hydroxymethylpyrimidine kinase/phosphomethylpyrimidine kinase [Fructilactobacillus frigidiflavus]|uniref:bifunctional hydroxymethylpyrimidine kinase/phosphomethylpyrimidine kinase n=1 Tax=Fructilactobacillus frigidiflavus TaxID=3242688 RepID=UPI00375800E1